VADVTQEVIASFTARHPQIAGVGVGLAGTVRERAVAVESPFLHWSGVSFGPLLAERTGLPVVLENDVAALVEAETWFGAGRGINRFAVLTIGAGIGYGLVVDGNPVRTPDDSLDLGSHWIIDTAGPLTPQGRRGSATSLLTIPSIEYQARAATGTTVDYEEILDQARRGRPAASRVIGEAARGLGVLIAQIANFALPDKLLLAGEGVGLMDVAGDLVRATVAEHRHPGARPVELEVKAADFHDWARGAAVLAIQVLVLGAEHTVGTGNAAGTGNAVGTGNVVWAGGPGSAGSPE
jgi:predicted NBD/HSP70 family sugar kinase